MHELKDIILARISDLNILNKSDKKSKVGCFNLILEQRNGQQNRTKKQVIILAHASSTGFECTIDEINKIVVQICTLYDEHIYEKVQKNKSEKIMESMYRLLRALFYAHEYKQKIRHLKYVFNRTYSAFLPYLVLALLSDWSKKQYAIKLKQFLGQQEQPQQQKQNIQINEPSNIQIIQSPVKSQNIIKEDTQIQQTPVHKNQQHTRTNSQQSGMMILKSVNSAKLLTIYSRTTFYSYVSGQLQELYQLTGLVQLDVQYLKMLPKKKNNGNLVYLQNINRAAEVLLQCGMNKQIKNSIKQYANRYQSYKQGLRRNKISKMNKIHHSVRSMSDHIASNDNKNKKSYQAVKKYSCGICQTEPNELPIPQIQYSSIGSEDHDKMPKINKQTFQLYQDVKNKIKCQLMSKLHNNRLPILVQSMQKSGKNYQQFVFKSNLFRFQTQQPVIENQQSINKVQSGFKAPGRTLKGIIVKNFISNKEKSVQKINKQSQKQKRYLQLNLKLSLKNNEHSPRSKQLVDIRSLRQKTKALLKNFNLINNY